MTGCWAKLALDQAGLAEAARISDLTTSGHFALVIRHPLQGPSQRRALGSSN